jgi:hypothetical protein
MVVPRALASLFSIMNRIHATQSSSSTATSGRAVLLRFAKTVMLGLVGEEEEEVSVEDGGDLVGALAVAASAAVGAALEEVVEDLVVDMVVDMVVAEVAMAVVEEVIKVVQDKEALVVAMLHPPTSLQIRSLMVRPTVLSRVQSSTFAT